MVKATAMPDESRAGFKDFFDTTSSLDEPVISDLKARRVYVTLYPTQDSL